MLAITAVADRRSWVACTVELRGATAGKRVAHAHAVVPSSSDTVSAVDHATRA
jgi:hypothetical protein